MGGRTHQRGRTQRKTVAAALSLGIALLFLTCFAAAGENSPDFLFKKEALVEKLVAKGLTVNEARALLDDERVAIYPQILEKKGKGINYFQRKFGLLTRASLERGLNVIKDNLEELKRIESTFGVEKEAIVSILRVETNFGRFTGNYPVFNSLLTMTILQNRRSGWAEDEWLSLIMFSREGGLDPLTIKGSWAGAFGLCQFVPSSYVKYGIDGNRDGRVDLFNMADALASIANYLKSNGWEKDNLAKKRQAIYAYNHCDNYVDAVLAYAAALKKPSLKARGPLARSHGRPARHTPKRA